MFWPKLCPCRVLLHCCRLFVVVAFPVKFQAISSLCYTPRRINTTYRMWCCFLPGSSVLYNTFHNRDTQEPAGIEKWGWGAFKVNRSFFLFFSAWTVSHTVVVYCVCVFVGSGSFSLCALKVADSSVSPDPFSLPTRRWEGDEPCERDGERKRHICFTFFDIYLVKWSLFIDCVSNP